MNAPPTAGAEQGGIVNAEGLAEDAQSPAASPEPGPNPVRPSLGENPLPPSLGASPVPPGPRSALARLSGPLALVLAALFLFPMLGKSGIWDPYELDAAELARRVAIHVWHAPGLELAGARNTLPTLTDLGMGELPFTSMALGFKLFGLHDWSGRLPLALWAFAGVAVLYKFLARLVDPRAGLYGTVALVTMPLYFMQARTMLGDVVTMAALAMAFCGLAGAAFDGGGTASSSGALARLAWLAVGLVGLAAGFLSRGVLIGVAVPSLSVGLAWLVVRFGSSTAPSSAAPSSSSALSTLVGALSLALAGVALYVGLRALADGDPGAPLSRVLGVALLKKAPADSTFDLTIEKLGHSLFPWSAMLPFAVGRLLRAPVEALGDAARRREGEVRVALLIGASVCFAAFALLGPHAGPIPFSGTVLLAAIAGLAILDLERGAPPSRAMALASILLAIVLYADMVHAPEKALAVFYVDQPSFPKSFEDTSARVMTAVVSLFALASLLWFEGQPDDIERGVGSIARRRAAEYASILREVGLAWGGNLVFGMIVVEAALTGLAAMLFLGGRFGWAPVDRLPKNFSDTGLNLWWAVPVALAVALPALFLARDACSVLVRASRLSRAAWIALVALATGGLQSFGYYAELAGQLSPKEVFDAYGKLGPGQPLGLLGVRGRAGAYYDAGSVETFGDVTRASRWLLEGAGERRWLVVGADDLPKLNAMYRKERHANVPVLDGRSSQILLVSSELGGLRSQSWIDGVVLSEPPAPEHPLDAAFEDQLDVLGWEVRGEDGVLVSSIVPQERYHLRFYYRVTGPITGAWKAFIHIDGFQRRYNGDHAVVDGKYPMSLWQPGDLVVDDCTFSLEPNFTPGDYTLFFGFFTGDTRFRVARGPSQEDRVIGGAIRVR